MRSSSGQYLADKNGIILFNQRGKFFQLIQSVTRSLQLPKSETISYS